MNYEKAYKEALERAMIWQDHLYDTNDRDYADELNYIFPELQERKNEKINKNLITFFKDNYGTNSNANFAGIKVKDIVAWLEKQGENEKGERKKDDAYSEFAISAVEDYYGGDNPLRKEIVDWLKSLKQRIGE